MVDFRETSRSLSDRGQRITERRHSMDDGFSTWNMACGVVILAGIDRDRDGKWRKSVMNQLGSPVKTLTRKVIWCVSNRLG